MALFDTFRRSPGKARPVGRTLERGTENEQAERRRDIAVKVGIFTVLVAITLLVFPRGDFFEYTVQEGDVWRRETLTAPFDFAIYKPPDTLAAERQAVQRNTPAYFREIPGSQERLTANRDTVAQQLDRIFNAYESYAFNKSRGRLEEAIQDSLSFVELRSNAQPKLTADQWQLLLNDYLAGVPGLATSSRQPRYGEPLADELLHEAWSFFSQLLTFGVLDVPLDSVRSEEIIIRNEEEITERRRSKDDVYGINEVHVAAQQHFQRQFEERPELVNIITTFMRVINVQSLEYLRAATIRAWEQEMNNISPTRGKVAQGEAIVRKGDVITPEIKQKLTSLERGQADRTGPALAWKQTLGQVLMSIATYAIFFLYLFMVRRPIFDSNKRVLLIALLFVFIVGLFGIAIRVPQMAMYAVPVAIVSVLLTVIFDSRVGLFATLTLALLGGLVMGYDFEFMFATLFAGTLGVFSVRDIKNRGQFFLSALMVFVGYVVVLGATWLFVGRSPERISGDLIMMGINSFLLILAYPLLWVFERSFGVTTDLTLLELSDTNRPLLKELSLRAPGTFNHSLQVANLAEAAASAVGANALLTRVGALYHDIGKMLKPEYFVENQRPGDNPHDQLKPRMSALIIASHVKEGLEMARQYNLPQRVLDFIPMHHGTTRIEYFYRKAVADRKETDPEVLESEFRYPGPRPFSKETGILMLSDGVEAASRSLSDPTHKRLETLIDMIIKTRIEDHQLDDTDLTFQDLKKIKETYLSLLMGIYHVRVKYPGQDKEMDDAAKTGEPGKGKVIIPDTSETHQDVREIGLVGVPENSVPERPVDTESNEDAQLDPEEDLDVERRVQPPPVSGNGVSGDGAGPVRKDTSKEQDEATDKHTSEGNEDG